MHLSMTTNLQTLAPNGHVLFDFYIKFIRFFRFKEYLIDIYEGDSGYSPQHVYRAPTSFPGGKVAGA
jgi:hypothetical protein